MADAVEVALPPTPRCVLFLGPKGTSVEPRAQMRGSEAENLAETLNTHVIVQSLS